MATKRRTKTNPRTIWICYLSADELRSSKPTSFFGPIECAIDHAGTSARPRATRLGPVYSGSANKNDLDSGWPLALMREGIGLLAQRDAHRGARQIEGLAHRVGQIAQIGLRDRVGARAEQHEA